VVLIVSLSRKIVKGLFLDANDYTVPYHVAELFEFRTKPTEFGESNEMGQQCLNFDNGAVMDVKECQWIWFNDM